MKWQRARQSQNVEDRRGSGWRGDGTSGWRGGGRLPVRGGLGLGGLIAIVLIGWVMGISPMEMLGLISQQQGDVPAQSAPERPSERDATNGPTALPADPQRDFVAINTPAGFTGHLLLHLYPIGLQLRFFAVFRQLNLKLGLELGGQGQICA